MRIHFVLARAQERHADEYAVELAGKEIAAVMLARFQLKRENLLVKTSGPGFSANRRMSRRLERSFRTDAWRIEQPIGRVNAQKWF